MYLNQFPALLFCPVDQCNSMAITWHYSYAVILDSWDKSFPKATLFAYLWTCDAQLVNQAGSVILVFFSRGSELK